MEDKRKTDKQDKGRINGMPGVILLSVLLMIVSHWTEKFSWTVVAKISIVDIIVLFCGFFFLQWKLKSGELFKRDSKKETGIILTGYFLSLSIILFCPSKQIGLFWMIGAIGVGFLNNANVGMMLQILFGYLYCTLYGKTIDYFILYVLFGITLIFLQQFYKRKRTIGYGILLAVSFHIVIEIVLQEFLLNQLFLHSVLWSALSVIVMILIVVFCDYLRNIKDKRSQKNLKMLFAKIKQRFGKTENGIGSVWKNFMKEQEIKKYPSIEELEKREREQQEKDYEVLIKEDFFLLQALRTNLPSIYEHSAEVAQISRLIAEEFDCNAALVYAGGLYHEIGRLKGTDYIANGVDIAKAGKFPKPLIALIEQHNMKAGLPKSKEAAILMLTEHVVTSYRYLEKNKKERGFSIEALVKKICELCLKKGVLDKSGLQPAEFEKIQELFIDVFSNKTI